MRNTISFLFVMAIFWGCTPQEGTVFGDPDFSPIDPGLPALPTDFKVTFLDVTQVDMAITGEELDKATEVKITGPSNFIKTFDIGSQTFSEIIATAVDTVSLPLGVALNLIIENANGQSSFPITFTLQPNSVATSNIQDGAVGYTKILNGSTSRLKLNKEPTDNPDDGQVLKWNDASSTFIFADDAGAGSGGTGTVTNVNLGSGIVGAGSSETVVANIVVDTDTTGDGSLTKIPFFNSSNQLVIDTSDKNNTMLLFKEINDNNYYFYNDGSLRIHDVQANLDAIIVDPGGQVTIPIGLKVSGENVCLEDGSNCQSVSLNITGTSPILVSAPTGNVDISFDSGTEPGKGIVLSGVGPVGELPAVSGKNLLETVTSIIPGISLTSSAPDGNVTLDVTLGGAGNAQAWLPRLDNLGVLNPNDNAVIIGTGSSFTVESGLTLQRSLGLEIGVDVQGWDDDLDDIAALSPGIGIFIGSDGIDWVNKTTPACASGAVISGNGSDFSCTNTFSTEFSGARFISNKQSAIELRPDWENTSIAGEIRFFETTTPTNYVGFKAPSTIAADVVWTLPNSDGNNGQALITNGSGTLAWANSVPSVNAQTGTTYTLTANDCGNVITLNNASAITLSVPVLNIGCVIEVIQLGTGQVTIAGTGGMNARNAFNLFKTRTRYSVVTVTVITATDAIVAGDIN